MAITIYHYKKCKKSRAALDYIRSLGIEPVIVNYIEDGINTINISNIITSLGISPIEMVRSHEDFYKENLQGKILSNQEWIEVFSENPKLLRRPIVVNHEKTIIADPPGMIDQLI